MWDSSFYIIMFCFFFTTMRGVEVIFYIMYDCRWHLGECFWRRKCHAKNSLKKPYLKFIYDESEWVEWRKIELCWRLHAHITHNPMKIRKEEKNSNKIEEQARQHTQPDKYFNLSICQHFVFSMLSFMPCEKMV